MSKGQAKSLPVLMYHYINSYPNSIAVSPAVFEEQCRTLAEKGFRGVSLDEAEAFLIHGEPLPPKSVFMTFDDGYLDNYFYAQPIMRKYGHQGVVCVVSARVEEGDSPKAVPEMLFAGTAKAMPELDTPVQSNSLGYATRRDIFCNRAELQLMEEAGTLRVIAHSKEHMGVYTGPEFGGFIRPGPQVRTFYHAYGPRPWGLPKFPVKPGLSHRAFIPSPELVEAIRTLVPQDEVLANAFFEDEARVAALQALVQGFAGKMGRLETDKERTERMQEEIQGGKEALENLLGKPLRTLCWPWGAWCEEARQVARAAGFEALLTTQEGVNPPGNPWAVHRFKAKNKAGGWLASRVWLYANPLLGKLYARCRM